VNQSSAFFTVAQRSSLSHADAAGTTAATSTTSTSLVRNSAAIAINLAGWKLDAGDQSQ
jgi:hypothetical protein